MLPLCVPFNNASSIYLWIIKISSEVFDKNLGSGKKLELTSSSTDLRIYSFKSNILCFLYLMQKRFGSSKFYLLLQKPDYPKIISAFSSETELKPNEMFHYTRCTLLYFWNSIVNCSNRIFYILLRICTWCLDTAALMKPYWSKCLSFSLFFILGILWSSLFARSNLM